MRAREAFALAGRKRREIRDAGKRQMARKMTEVEEDVWGPLAIEIEGGRAPYYYLC